MVGAPPPADKPILFANGDHLRLPQLRWSVANFRRFLPSTDVWRGDGPVAQLRLALRDDIDGVTFRPRGRSDTMTWAQSLEANCTDAIVVLHKGRIVYARYLGVMTPRTQHMSMSVTKSLFGTLGAMLVAERRLDEHALVTKYIPEPAGSAWGDATVRVAARPRAVAAQAATVQGRSGERWVSRPRRTVSRTFVSSSCRGGPARMSWDNTTKSAYLPAVIVPVRSSSKLA